MKTTLQNLKSIYAITNSSVFTVGANGTGRKTSNGGELWTLGLSEIVGLIIYRSGTASVFENQLQTTISVYPNPFSTLTTLQLDKHFKNATLTVDDCFGLTDAQIKNICGQTIFFNRDNLPNRLYFVHLTQDNHRITIKK